MPKTKLYEDELYPFFDITDSDSGILVNVRSDTVRKWRYFMKMFYLTQKQMKKAYEAAETKELKDWNK